jgi:glycosyltransferase involved in cell wall biosynthesis
MKRDFLVAHPSRHHALELCAGISRSGASLQLLTPFYKKGIGRFIARLQPAMSARMNGYWHPEIRESDVVCPPWTQVQRLVVSAIDPERFPPLFDRAIARYVRRNADKIRCLVTLQDYMPLTVAAAADAGVKIWSDQIHNQSASAMQRIGAHYDALGLPPPKQHDESRNLRIVRRSSIITVPSAYGEEAIADHVSAPRSVYKIPYGTSLPTKHGKAEDTASVFNIVARANNVKKGGHLVLRAVERWGTQWRSALDGKELCVTILGALEPGLVRLLSQIQIPDGIRLVHGDVPHTLVSDVYCSGHLFLMPSLSESLSPACLEALAYGLPMVVTRYTGVEDIEGNCGVYIDDDVDSVGSGVLRMLERRRDLRDMGYNARQMAASRYSWSDYRDRISRLAQDMVA